MAKPSIFSRNYEQQMRRRRTNIILVVLIIICASYFGLRYYMDKNGITLFDIKNIKQNSNVTPTPKTNKPSGITPTPSAGPNTAADTGNQHYEYALSDGRKCIVEYNTTGAAQGFTGIKVDGDDVSYSISGDKKYIVLEDVKSQNIVVGDLSGSFRIISSSSYKSKSTGVVINKAEILKSRPDYSWARKPHFTSDNRIVYISDLPYLKSQGGLYLWIISVNGGLSKMAGQLPATDISKISYGSYDSTGRLQIIANGSSYYLAPGSYKLVK